MPDLVQIAQKLAVWALPMLFAFTGQAMATAWAAHKRGADTPARAGRLSFDPFKHVDPIGTIAVPLLCVLMGGFLIGWPKPVPVNAHNFPRPRREIGRASC